MDRKDTIDILNRLIETSKDGEYGFQSCADHARDLDLKQFFGGRATECAQASTELKQVVVALGGEPDNGGSASGAVHRGWVAIKSTLAGYTDLALLEECERGEDKAVATYRDCLKRELAPDVRALIERQLQGVKQNHDEVRARRDALRALPH